MASEFHRNAERYYDPTAGAALLTVEKGERMEYKVGDVISAVRQGSPLEKRLIVLANDGYVLMGCVLLAKEMANCVPVMCNVEMYANPYRLEHISFGTNDIKLIRVATDEELMAFFPLNVKEKRRKHISEPGGSALCRDGSLSLRTSIPSGP